MRLLNAHYWFGEDIWTHFSRGHLVCHANINFLFSVLQKIIYLFSECIPTNILNSEPKNAQNQTKGGLVCQSGRPNPWRVHEKWFQYGECYWTIFPFLNGPKIISLCLILQYLMWIWYSESLVQKIDHNMSIQGVKVASGLLPCSQWFHGRSFSGWVL